MKSQLIFIRSMTFFRFMAKHVCGLYDLIRSNSDTNKQKNWKEVENRVKTQVPLRIMSCVQLASKLTSHYKVRGRPFDF